MTRTLFYSGIDMPADLFGDSDRSAAVAYCRNHEWRTEPMPYFDACDALNEHRRQHDQEPPQPGGSSLPQETE